MQASRVLAQDVQQGIQTLLVGGHAVNAHGVTRATLDVDLMIVSDQEEKVRSLIDQFGNSEVEIELRNAWENR